MRHIRGGVVLAAMMMGLGPILASGMSSNVAKAAGLRHDTEGYETLDQVLDVNLNYIIWQDDSVHKVPRYVRMQSRNKEFRHWSPKGKKVSLHAVRGESESFQIAVAARWNDPVKIGELKVGELTGPNQASIPASAVHVYQEGYVDRLYPDVLFPPDTFKKVPFSENVTWWITVDVGQKLTPGKYTARINLPVNGETQHIPLEVKVSPVVLPKRTNVHAMLFNARTQDIKRYYPMPDAKLSDFIGKHVFPLLADRRIAHGHLQPYVYKLKHIDRLSQAGVDAFEKWGEWWDRRGFQLGRVDPSGRKPLNVKKLKQWARLYMPVIRKHHWQRAVYIRLPYDEATAGPEAKKNREAARAYKKYLPGIPLSHTFGGSLGRSNRKQVQTRLEAFAGLVDIWSLEASGIYVNNPWVGQWFDQRLRTHPEESLSWYIHYHTPVGDPALDLRGFFWHMFRHGASRTTLWSITLWHQKGATRKMKGRPERRIWEMPRGFGLNRTAGPGVGNGNMIYPGEKAPLASMRLEIIRDGTEDYDLFTLLAHKLGALAREGGHQKLIEQGRKLLQIPDKLLVPMQRQWVKTLPAMPSRAKRQAFLDRRMKVIHFLERLPDAGG